MEKLPSHSPEAALLGEMTECCQSIGKYGQSPTYFGITHPHAGFYVIRQASTGKIISQALAWVMGNFLVFDSIEATATAKNNHSQMLSEFWMGIAHLLAQSEHIDYVMVGKSSPTALKLGLSYPGNYPSPPGEVGYSDSRQQNILASSQLPLGLFWLYRTGNLHSTVGAILSETTFSDSVLEDFIAYCIAMGEPKQNIIAMFETLSKGYYLPHSSKLKLEKQYTSLFDYFTSFNQLCRTIRSQLPQQRKKMLEELMQKHSAYAFYPYNQTSLSSLVMKYGSPKQITSLFENSPITDYQKAILTLDRQVADCNPEALIEIANRFPHLLNWRDNTSGTPIFWTIFLHSPLTDLIKTWLNAYPELLIAQDGMGNTLLHLLISPDDNLREKVLYLLKINPNLYFIPDNEGNLPIQLVIKNRWYEQASLFIDPKGEVLFIPNQKGKIAFNRVLCDDSPEGRALISTWFKAYNLYNFRMEDSSLLLMNIAKNGFIELALHLLEAIRTPEDESNYWDKLNKIIHEVIDALISTDCPDISEWEKLLAFLFQGEHLAMLSFSTKNKLLQNLILDDYPVECNILLSAILKDSTLSCYEKMQSISKLLTIKCENDEDEDNESMALFGLLDINWEELRPACLKTSASKALFIKLIPQLCEEYHRLSKASIPEIAPSKQIDSHLAQLRQLIKAINDSENKKNTFFLMISDDLNRANQAIKAIVELSEAKKSCTLDF